MKQTSQSVLKHKLGKHEGITISEICELWKRHENSVRYHIDSGKFIARKSGNVWIVGVSSIISVWGLPDDMVVIGGVLTYDIPF